MDVQPLTLTPLTLLLAAGTGLLSFVSPCVLPLVPAYLGYVTGLTLGEAVVTSSPERRGAYPNLKGVATRAVERATLLGLNGPREYFVQSIVTPQASAVEGFAPLMLDWKQMRLTEQGLADLAAFLGTRSAP